MANKKSKPVKVYRLVPIFRKEDAKQIDIGHQAHVIGEIGDYVIASIPPGMSASCAQEVTQGVQAALRKPVLCLTHNIELIALQEIPRKEATEILQQTVDAATETETAEEGTDGG